MPPHPLRVARRTHGSAHDCRVRRTRVFPARALSPAGSRRTGDPRICRRPSRVRPPGEANAFEMGAHVMGVHRGGDAHGARKNDKTQPVGWVSSAGGWDSNQDHRIRSSSLPPSNGHQDACHAFGSNVRCVTARDVHGPHHRGYGWAHRRRGICSHRDVLPVVEGNSGAPQQSRLRPCRTDGRRPLSSPSIGAWRRPSRRIRGSSAAWRCSRHTRQPGSALRRPSSPVR